MLRAAIILALCNGCCGLLPGDSCGSSGPPAPDSCSGALTGSIDQIEIGHDDDAFTVYSDGDSPHIIRGGQGATMMGIRLRLTGSSIPDCITQSTMYVEMAQGQSTVPIKTYLESDGSYTTKPLWIPGYFPTSFGIECDVGGKSKIVHLGATDM